MKPTIETESIDPKNPIAVTISVTQFQDVLAGKESRTGRGTSYTMKLKARDPRACIEGDTIYVKRPGGPIRFTINGAAADKEHYYPVGISFVREGDGKSSEKARLGMLTFPQSEIRLDGRSLSITDIYKDHARSVRYKFSLLIQRGSDGRLGIIDPGIEHDNSH
jgi:hypothetical protein